MKLLLAAILLLIVDAHIEGNSSLANETDADGPLVRTNIDEKFHKKFRVFPFISAVAAGTTAFISTVRAIKDRIFS
ncbi:hypothetical protein Y032_0495g2464 [Ancylostoma ceylanicum]|nr:hypothetical protein Y032_0495g2464 [Ancylostoma ceylanicum]